MYHTLLWRCQDIRRSNFSIQSKYFIFFKVVWGRAAKVEETLPRTQDAASGGPGDFLIFAGWNSRLNPAGGFQGFSQKLKNPVSF